MSHPNYANYDLILIHYGKSDAFFCSICKKVGGSGGLPSGRAGGLAGRRAAWRAREFASGQVRQGTVCTPCIRHSTPSDRLPWTALD